MTSSGYGRIPAGLSLHNPSCILLRSIDYDRCIANDQMKSDGALRTIVKCNHTENCVDQPKRSSATRDRKKKPYRHNNIIW